MIIAKQEYKVNGINYIIKSATVKDAQELSELRVQIDGETENLDREKGEGFINAAGFEQLIHTDTENSKNLFLVRDVKEIN